MEILDTKPLTLREQVICAKQWVEQCSRVRVDFRSSELVWMNQMNSANFAHTPHHILLCSIFIFITWFITFTFTLLFMHWLYQFLRINLISFHSHVGKPKLKLPVGGIFKKIKPGVERWLKLIDDRKIWTWLLTNCSIISSIILRCLSETWRPTWHSTTIPAPLTKCSCSTRRRRRTPSCCSTLILQGSSTMLYLVGICVICGYNLTLLETKWVFFTLKIFIKQIFNKIICTFLIITEHIYIIKQFSTFSYFSVCVETLQFSSCKLNAFSDCMGQWMIFVGVS